MQRCVWIFVLLASLTASVYAQAPAGRIIVQTVFSADGKPAARTRVSASFIRDKKLGILTAETDAAGKVTWTNLPPSGVIVWGDGIPAGVLPDEATEVTNPLPPFTAPANWHGSANFRFIITNPGSTLTQITWSSLRSFSDTRQYDPGGTKTERENALSYSIGWGHGEQAFGKPFSLLVSTREALPRFACLTDIYLPLPPKDNMVVEYALTLRNGVAIDGQLLDAAGKPVAGVSRLEAVPLSTIGDIPLPVQDFVRPGAPWITRLPDGKFTLSALLPGTYRLLVDLYDESTPSPPSLLLKVEPGRHAARVMLPKPLLTLSAGTEVNWVTRNAPVRPRTLKVAAALPTLPVYGPKESLLALWYAPQPDRLMFWMPEITTAPRSLPLRSVILNAPGEVAEMRYLTIYGLLPYARYEAAIRDVTAILNTPDTATHLNLWPGRYLVNDQNQTIVATVEIPETGDRLVNLSVIPEELRKQNLKPAALPAQPVTTRISGLLLDAAGKPCANRTVRAGAFNWNVWEDYQRRCTAVTDAAGRFTLPGVVPGSQVIGTQDNQSIYTWSLQVPKGGMTDVTLRMTATPPQLFRGFNDGSSSQSALTWWLPDSGKPMAVWGYCQNMTPGIGRLWLVDYDGKSISYRFSASTAGGHDLPRPNATPLGIVFPYPSELLLPGAVTLTGQGKLAGMVVRIPSFRWCPSSLLGTIAGQLDDVPPGDYRITVETPRGNVEAPVIVGEDGGQVKLDFPKP